ncbi:hypothetical protein C8Q76DRAFT_798456 [Earliella scabrosa]|nr:hypothetical protein C8Q76DRAFT_798456 [Earliella scabrosa]
MNREYTPIVSLFSAADIKLTTSEPGSACAASAGHARSPHSVMVLIAEIIPMHYSLVANDQNSPDHQNLVLEAVNDKLLMLPVLDELSVYLKPFGIAFWYQFVFQGEHDYWAFVVTIARIRCCQLNRRMTVVEQGARLRDEFLLHFNPTVRPWDSETVNRMQHNKDEGRILYTT